MTFGRLRPQAIDRLVRLVLAAMVVSATVAMLLPGLAVLFTFTIVLIPLAAAMAAAPTALLWAGPSLVAFAVARWAQSTVATGLACAVLVGTVTAAVMSLVPQRANAATSAFARGFVSETVPERVASGPVDVVVQMADGWPWESEDTSPARCTWDCERALYSGFAKQFAIGSAADFDPGSNFQRVSIVYELVPVAAGCDSAMVLGSRAEGGDFPAQTNRQQLFLRDALTGSGLCVRSRRAAKVAGDWVLVERRDGPAYESYADRDFDWRLHRISHAERLEVFRRSGTRLELAASHAWVRSEPLSQPLGIELPLNFAIRNPGGWAHQPHQDSGSRIPVGLAAIFDAKLAVDYLDAD